MLMVSRFRMAVARGGKAGRPTPTCYNLPKNGTGAGWPAKENRMGYPNPPAKKKRKTCKNDGLAGWPV